MSKTLFEVAQDAKIGLIVQLKDNQPSLKAEIEHLTATAASHDRAQSRNHGRNRDEIRVVTVFDPADALADTDWHPHVAAIIRVERSVVTRSPATGLLHSTTETAFYIANRTITAARAGVAIRAHWNIENTSHYTRDVTMGEDRSRIRTNPGIFARLRSFGFNILMVNKTGTMKQDRYRAALAGVQHLLSLITISKH